MSGGRSPMGEGKALPKTEAEQDLFILESSETYAKEKKSKFGAKQIIKIKKSDQI